MKAKSVSGASYIVSNLDKTIEFYESLGFNFKSQDAQQATGYVNWYWTVFEIGKVGDVTTAPRMWLSVDDVEAVHSELAAAGYEVSEPEKTKLNYQFALTDPDGYRLMIFKRR